MNDTLTASPDPFATSLAGRKLGRYEVLARLASGGMAGVYVARAIGVAGFERLFAIKVLHPHLAHEEEFISMFLDEARLAARIRHPNVVPTLDISDTPDAGFYLVMEYIEGDHLGALLQKAWKLGKRLPFPVTLRIVVDALEGLAAAHNLTDESGRHLQLVHRDISPHNIMVSSDGIARITDFGVAKAEVRLSTTREGQFKGKLAYMAPEHASNGDADQRSDLFSMAIILWESLAGRRLFRAENHAATLNKICLEPIPLLSSVDPGLAAFDPLLIKALARDPNDRFQSAEEFAEAVEEAAPTLGGLAKAREVAQLVRDYASEKLTRDAELIRSAIAQLTAIGGASEPPPALEQVPPIVEMPLQSPPMLAASTAHALPDDYEELNVTEFHEQRSRRLLWVTVVVVVAAAAGATAALWSRSLALLSPSAVPSAELPPPVTALPEAPSAQPSAAPNAPAGDPAQAPANDLAKSPSPEGANGVFGDPRDTRGNDTRGSEARGASPASEPRAHERARPREIPGPTNTNSNVAPGTREAETPPPAAAPLKPAPRRGKEAEPGKPAGHGEDILPNPYH
ncbi:MAG: protein kinase [Polyangiales bacterium]